MNVVIFGSSGHAKVLFDIISLVDGLNFIGFIDENNKSKSFLKFPIIKKFDKRLISEMNINGGIIGIGDNFVRHKVHTNILKIIPEFNFINLIHPSSTISENIELGKGNAFMAGSVINIGSKIGDHCIINTKSSIDHDCSIHNFSSIAPGCSVGGNVTLKEFAALGIGSCIKHNVTVEKNCIIGGGSFVNKDTEKNSVYFGVPSRKKRNHKLGESYL